MFGADRTTEIVVVKDTGNIAKAKSNDCVLFAMDVSTVLDALPEEPIFDLVVTSPPYNIGKAYEKKMNLTRYMEWQEGIIRKIYPRLKDTGSICWQVGNYVEDGAIVPLDYVVAPIFKSLNMQLRNRIIWHFGHGLHTKRRFSGRYEVVLWYTKQKDIRLTSILSGYLQNIQEKGISKVPVRESFQGIR